MKKNIYLVLVSILMLSCNNLAKKIEFSNQKMDTLRVVDYNINSRLSELRAKEFGITFEKSGEYNDLLRKIKSDRISLLNLYQNSNNKQKVIDSVSYYLTETLLNKILPFWYGMKWSISGYSNVPQDGVVGCSYLVANTLQHLNFNINRYKVGQAASEHICKTFQVSDSILVFKNVSQTEIVSYIKNNLKEGFYTLGLDYHAGYILFYHNEVFMIHASWLYPGAVVIEYADYTAGMQSNRTVIGEITTNDSLIVKWLNNEFVEVKDF